MKKNLKISSIDVGLFGRFCYSIEFAEKGSNGEGITIITAPNGYGKSTILRMIDYLFRGEYERLYRVNFSGLILTLSNGIQLIVSRTEDSSMQDTSENEDEEVESNTKWTGLRFERSGSPQEPWVISHGSLTAADLDEENYGAKGERFRDNSRRGTGGFRVWSDEPHWLTTLRHSVKILYISADRLRPALLSDRRIDIGEPRSGERIEYISSIVRKLIGEFDSNYSDSSRRFERKFPARVIAAINDRTPVSTSDISELMARVRKLETAYQQLGLLSEAEAQDVDLAKSESAALVVLKIYLEGVEEKLRSLQADVETLQVFIETLNSMLLFKKLELRQRSDEGFKVIGDDGKSIPLVALSSGEQHLIVLLGLIIFRSVDSGVILLDEPEISFHPEWQDRFPDLLEKVVKMSGCMVVMATHSPSMIGDRWDSVIELAVETRQ